MHVASMQNRTGEYRVLVEKPYVKRPFGRPRIRKEDNIELEFQANGWRVWN